MKKIVFLLSVILLSAGCSVDDGENIVVQLSEVSSIDLPEFFEEDEVYEIEVEYLLPTGCHTAAGLDVYRLSNFDADRRKIYVSGVSTYDANAGECTTPNSNPLKKATFVIEIDETEPFTFFVFKGLSTTNQPIYETIEVPVGAPSEVEADN